MPPLKKRDGMLVPVDRTEFFNPEWAEEAREDGMFEDSNVAGRSKHPDTFPPQIEDLLAATYRQCRHRKLAGRKLKKFGLFNKLPLELRRMIWKFTLPGRRVVEIRYDHKTGKIWAPNKVPVTLQVNFESRCVAQKYYALSFATKTAPAMTYFDFEIDQLYVGVGNVSTSDTDPAHDFFSAIKRRDLHRIQNVAIDAEIEWVVPSPNLTNYSTRKICYGLKALKTLTITQGQDDDLDYILMAPKHESSELQAWQITKIGQPRPFHLPTDLANPVPIEVACLSAIWATFEDARFASYTSVETIRIVSHNILANDKQWRKRSDFLDEVFYNTTTGCVYARDRNLHNLEIMEKFHPDDFAELELRLSKDFVDLWNPFWIHATQTPCVCKCGHQFKWAAEGVDFSGVDIKVCIEEVYASRRG